MLSQNLPALRQCLAFALLLFIVPLAAQENCANGIDDDGDGLIDLNDRGDCSCGLPSATVSLLPNPSLEEFSAEQEGCSSQQPGGLPDGTNQANCLVGWQRISLGTTDVWNALTLPGSAPSFPSELPQPLPSGTSVAGFWVGIKDTQGIQFQNGDGSAVRGYREYLAACLTGDHTIEAGEDYRLNFSLGFMKPQIMELSYTAGTVWLSSPPAIELSVYGVKHCDQLHFGSFYDCPEASGAAGYELISNITVSGNPGEWTAATLDFTARGDYAAFAIGGSCAEDIKRPDGGRYRNYYFIDDLILNKQEAFGQPVAGPVSVSGQSMCADELVLTGQAASGAAYQWYRDGIALAQATDRQLLLRSGEFTDGNYALRVTTATGCAVTDPVRIQQPVIQEQFPDSIALCGSGESITIYPSLLSAASYKWSDGSTRDLFTVREPGTYSVTITSACVERVEEIVATSTESATYTYVLNPAVPCIGDTVEVSLKTNWYAPLTIYMLPSGEQHFVNGNTPIRVVAGETNEIRALLLTSCGMKSDLITIPELTPLEVLATVTDLNCHGPQGSIALSPASEPVEKIGYRWTDPDGLPLWESSASITASKTGQYSVTVSGGSHCPATYAYEVSANDNFALAVSPTDVSCGSDATAIALATGGTPPYAVNWLKDPDAPPIGRNSSLATGLDRGTYVAEVTDQRGCSTSTTFTVKGPAPLRIQSVTTDAVGCHAEASGTLSVTAAGGTLPYRYRFEGSDQEQIDPVFTGLPEGRHAVIVTDALACDSRPHEVEVDLPATFEIDAGEDRKIYLGEKVVLNLRIDGLDPEAGEINWTPAEQVSFPRAPYASLSVESSPTTTTEYFVTVTSPDNCSRTDSITVTVDKTSRVYAPTAFSPNQDGNNDVFTLYANSVVAEILDLRVFDRWGGLVWEKPRDAPGEWDGTRYGEPMTIGTYVYLGKLLLRDGTTSSIHGSVLLTK